MFGKFNFNSLGVSTHGFLFIQQIFCVCQPRQQLIQGMLELPQG